MSKIKVLVVPSDRAGVSMFRSVDPHLKLQELYPDDFFVDIVTAGTDNFSWDDEKELKSIDIIHFHRTLPHIKNGRVEPAYGEDAKNLFVKLQSHGIKLIMDLDDYWDVTQDHPAWRQIKEMDMGKKLIHNLRLVDYVTTTTKLYADEIRKYNKNVIVLPNAIDPSQSQYQPKPEPTDKKLRVGWLGGSSHLEDLKLASDSVTEFLSKHKEDTQFVLCGFDLRGNIVETNPQTGQQTTRKIRPEESVWVRYEELFTKNYQTLKPEYVKELKTYEDSTDGSKQNYRRVWTKPITTYASNYDLFDVSLAPVKEHMFNKMKSQLKVIEAGFHKKALIASDFGPYQIDLKNAYVKGGGFDETGNAFLVDKYKNHKMWAKHLEFLYQNPDVVEKLGENLYNSVQKYHINVVTEHRGELYKSIMNGSEKEVNNTIKEINEV